jgi:Methionine aminopeptidase
LHEEPKIQNYIGCGINYRLKPGMVLAIEPMITEGSSDNYTDRNGWTVRTCDQKLAAHFEHTVAILEDGPKILTML